MELTKEQLDFLNECEEEFKNRYTDADEDFLKIKLSTLINPPILDPWPPCDKDKDRNRRDSHRRSQRYDDNRRGNGRYEEDSQRCSDRRRTKRKRRDRHDREKSHGRENRRERNDDRSSRDRRRHKDHRRSEDRRRRGDSYRDEDKDRRYRRDNNHRDRRRNRDNYRENHIERGKENCREREKSRSREKSREQEERKQDVKPVCQNENPILEPSNWNTYVSKHDVYENYRPYF